MLYIVSTPIGNLNDMTYRAISSLKESDVVVAEDTRTAGKLFKHFEIEKKRLISYNDYNSSRKIPEIISLLKEGRIISIISENVPSSCS